MTRRPTATCPTRRRRGPPRRRWGCDMHVETERPPLTHLFRDLSDDVRRLVRQEVELAKAELGETAQRYAKRAASLAVAGGLLFFASLALLAAFMYGLTALLDTFLPLGLAVWLAPLLVA